MGRTASTEPQCLYKGALYFAFIYYYHQCFLISSIDNTVAEVQNTYTLNTSDRTTSSHHRITGGANDTLTLQAAY